MPDERRGAGRPGRDHAGGAGRHGGGEPRLGVPQPRQQPGGGGGRADGGRGAGAAAQLLAERGQGAPGGRAPR